MHTHTHIYILGRRAVYRDPVLQMYDSISISYTMVMTRVAERIQREVVVIDVQSTGRVLAYCCAYRIVFARFTRRVRLPWSGVSTSIAKKYPLPPSRGGVGEITSCHKHVPASETDDAGPAQCEIFYPSVPGASLP